MIGYRKKVTSIQHKLAWVILLAVGLMVFFAPSAAILAQAEKTDLTMFITGAYPGNLTPGQDNQLFVTIRNNGNSTVTNIRFSSSRTPEGWTVTFNPASLESLSPGSSNTIQVYINPPASIEKGNYNLTLIAESDEVRTVTEAFFRIEGGLSYWAWIGIGIGVLAIIGFVFIFLRSGK